MLHEKPCGAIRLTDTDVPELVGYLSEQFSLLCMAAFEGIAPEYHIELKERPTMVWDVHPQFLTIQMMFIVGWSVMLRTIDCSSLRKYLFVVQP